MARLVEALQARAINRAEKIRIDSDLQDISGRVSSAVAESVTSEIREQVRSIHASLDAIEKKLKIPEAKDVDLGPILAAVNGLDLSPILSAVKGVRADVDLSPILDELRQTPKHEPRKTRWTFTVKRNRDGLIETIEAR